MFGRRAGRSRRFMAVMRIVLLGCGFHGRGIAYQLARSGRVDELLVLDRDAQRAARVGSKAGVPSGSIDVTDGDSLRATLVGADTVVNAVGPYHKTALGVIEAAIDVGVHYVDMNDDHEVAEAVLLDPAWDERARRAGVTVLMDCGVVPGLSGLLVRYASQQLDRTEAVAIRFGWNYDRNYPAAIQHFLRINSGDGPQYIDGRHARMAPFAGREDVSFQAPVGPTEVYFTGVPDPVAIARFIPGVQHATAKGAFYQEAANRLLEDMVKMGIHRVRAARGRNDEPHRLPRRVPRIRAGRAVFRYSAPRSTAGSSRRGRRKPLRGAHDAALRGARPLAACNDHLHRARRPRRRRARACSRRPGTRGMAATSRVSARPSRGSRYPRSSLARPRAATTARTPRRVATLRRHDAGGFVSNIDARGERAQNPDSWMPRARGPDGAVKLGACAYAEGHRSGHLRPRSRSSRPPRSPQPGSGPASTSRLRTWGTSTASCAFRHSNPSFARAQQTVRLPPGGSAPCIVSQSHRTNPDLENQTLRVRAGRRTTGRSAGVGTTTSAAAAIRFGAGCLGAGSRTRS